MNKQEIHGYALADAFIRDNKMTIDRHSNGVYSYDGETAQATWVSSTQSLFVFPKEQTQVSEPSREERFADLKVLAKQCYSREGDLILKIIEELEVIYTPH